VILYCGLLLPSKRYPGHWILGVSDCHVSETTSLATPASPGSVPPTPYTGHEPCRAVSFTHVLGSGDL